MKIVLLAVIVSCVCAMSAHAGEKDMELLGPDKWPTTVEATVADMQKQVPEDFKARIRKDPKDFALYFGFPMWVRNYYGLWRGNTALIEAACGKPCHPDTAAGVIVNRFVEEVRAQAPPEAPVQAPAQPEPHQ